MKINFARTGGFANIPIILAFDTAKLNAEKSEALTKLVEDALPFGANVEIRPDMFNYQLVVEKDDGTKHQIKTTDTDASDNLHRLFDWILKESRTKKA